MNRYRDDKHERRNPDRLPLRHETPAGTRPGDMLKAVVILAGALACLARCAGLL